MKEGCVVLCQVTQSCPTLCDPMDCSPPGSSVHGILQARILESVSMPFSSEGRFSSVQSLSRVQLSVTPWTVAHQVPPSIGFPRQEYCSGLPFPSSRDRPHPGIKPESPTLACRFFTTDSPGKPAEKVLGPTRNGR